MLTKIVDKVEYSDDFEIAISIKDNNFLNEYVLNPNTKIIRMGCCYNNRNLRYISLPNNLEKIESSAFEKCVHLKEINLPDNVKSIGVQTFNMCYSLEKIKLSKNLKKISPFAFSNCTALKEIIIPEGVEKICEGAFFNCNNLKKVILPSTLKVLENNVFTQCESLREISLPSGVQVEDTTFDDKIETIYIDKETLKKLPCFEAAYFYKIKEKEKISLDDLLNEGKTLRQIEAIHKDIGIEII